MTLLADDSCSRGVDIGGSGVGAETGGLGDSEGGLCVSCGDWVADCDEEFDSRFVREFIRFAGMLLRGSNVNKIDTGVSEKDLMET